MVKNIVYQHIFSILLNEHYQELHLKIFETLVDNILHNLGWGNRAMNPDSGSFDEIG